ncbi:MAG: hypothetical protein HYV19_03845 [Gemmatimonadetes bacterium]|nr:hypothetical protein [Gemmatimonadota bacterium]
MADLKEIALANLRLDTLNPRLDEDKQNQPAALKAMMESQGAKLIELVRDIAKNGLNPLDGFLVMQVAGDANDYVVLEGNRRTTALKLLANPKLGTDIFTKGQLTKLVTFAKEASITNDTEITCAVVMDRDEAVHWLRLRHGGELDGAGLVRWGTPERERFEARTGKTSPELRVLSFLVNKGMITQQEADEVGITNLRRLLSDGSVRQKLGVEIHRKTGDVKFLYPEKEVLKGLTAVARKLADDDFTVRTIYTDDNRADFIKRFQASELPNPRAKLGVAYSLSAGAAEGAGDHGGTRSKPRKVTARKNVAPSSPKLRIKQARIRDIYGELQILKLEKHTNAGAVLLRVFLELTVDNYMGVHTLKVQKANEKVTLKDKLQVVHDHLLAQHVMTKAALAPVRKAISDGGLLASSVSTFNLYVHSEKLSPMPRDVRVAWDNLQEFFVNIWK